MAKDPNNASRPSVVDWAVANDARENYPPMCEFVEGKQANLARKNNALVNRRKTKLSRSG